MHAKKIENVLALSSEERYGYLIRKLADTQEVWLLKDEKGYVTFADETGKITIPVFPEKEFAELYLSDNRSSCFLEKLDMSNFTELLDKAELDKIQIAGFPNTKLVGVIVCAIEMKNHLLYELQQYE